MNLLFWAIRHEELGYLPHIPSKRGFTWTEPSWTLPPRLFDKESAAKKALTWWVQGRWYGVQTQTEDGPEFDGVKVTKGTRRNLGHMSVVPVRIVDLQEIGMSEHLPKLIKVNKPGHDKNGQPMEKGWYVEIKVNNVRRLYGPSPKAVAATLSRQQMSAYPANYFELV